MLAGSSSSERVPATTATSSDSVVRGKANDRPSKRSPPWVATSSASASGTSASAIPSETRGIRPSSLGTWSARDAVGSWSRTSARISAPRLTASSPELRSRESANSSLMSERASR